MKLPETTARLWWVVFIICQVLDGLLTYQAVSRWGVTAEGNPLLSGAMVAIGVAPTLIFAKTLACSCGSFLFVVKVDRVLAGLTMFYVVAAIAPWFYILSLG